MQKLLRDIIFKYTNIVVDNEEKNLLDYPVPVEYWLYVITELEDLYNFTVIEVLEHMKYDEFTLKELSNRLILMSQ